MSPLEQLRALAGEVDRICVVLTAPSPERLDACSSALESATARLAALQQDLATLAPDPAVLAAAWRLHAAIRRAGALLDGAAVYHARWRQIVSVRLAGYGADGRAAEPAAHGRLCLTG